MTNFEKKLQELLEKGIKYQLTGSQLMLINKLVKFILNKDNSELFVLHGYAGTGKTSVISSLVKTLNLINKNYVLLAPTGRAAKVLSEYSGAKAFTIHKYIYYVKSSPNSSLLLTLKKNRLKNTIFIVDEASMINENNNDDEYYKHNLLKDLIKFVFEGYNCKLIFTGDTAQLPPVGLEYSPALDVDYLKSSFNLNITSHQLTEVVRQSKDSGILFNTTYLRQKITNNKISPPFFKTNNYDVFNITGYDLEEYLNESYSKYGLNNVIVICKTNKRALLFNNSIRNRILLKEEILTTGELLMVVKNNYFFLPKDSEAGFIANGDIIEITRIKKYIQIYGFDFVQATIKLIDYPEEKEIEVVIMINTLFSETASLTYNDYKTLYEAIALDYQNIKSKTEKTKKIRENIYLNALQVKYSYALTCHKTQGGQWKIVFIDQGYLNNEMINLEYLRWLYTAESRAINKLYFVNFKDEFFEK